MRISLVGMAGTGKSFWSKRLARRGFKRYGCDALIARRLRRRILSPNGSTMGLGEWMGFPYGPFYSEREALYLECERRVLTRVLDDIENGLEDGRRDVVVDTTGSVIYTGKDLLGRLRRLTTVVYLATPRQVKEIMVRAYVENPGPVLWMGTYRKRSGETDREALIRCYGSLLSRREGLYRQIADVTIGFSERRRSTFGVSEFLQKIVSTAGQGSPA